MNKWLTVYSKSQCGCNIFKMDITNRTFSFSFKNKVKGNKLRLHLGSKYGNNLYVESLSVVINGCYYPITVDGKQSFKVLSNSFILSDEKDVEVKENDTIEIRAYFKKKQTCITGINSQAIISKAGDYTLKEFVKDDFIPFLKDKRPIDIGIPMPLVSGVDIYTSCNFKSIAILGASNEYSMTWVQPFIDNIENKNLPYIVLNNSISGNRLLKSTGNKLLLNNLFGDALIKRIDWDLLKQSGVKYFILGVSGNDLFQVNTFACYPFEKLPKYNDMVNGFKYAINKAHGNGIKVIGLTITPLINADGSSTKKIDLREKINKWIMESNEFDYVYDIGRMVSSDETEGVMKETFNSGDYIHFNKTGGKYIADNFPYSIFDL